MYNAGTTVSQYCVLPYWYPGWIERILEYGTYLLFWAPHEYSSMLMEFSFIYCFFVRIRFFPNVTDTGTTTRVGECVLVTARR